MIAGLSTTGIVLAAGRGTRMGGPKATLLVGGRPLVVQHVEQLLDVGCDAVVVVVPTAARRAVEIAIGSHARARVVAADTESAAATLAEGLRHLRERVPRDSQGLRHVSVSFDAAPRSDAFVIAPVDMRPARAATFDALARTLAAEEDIGAATPTRAGRGGHPVLVRERFLRAFDGTRTLRDVVRDPLTQRVRVEVADPHVVDDLDTPAHVGGRASFIDIASRSSASRA